MISEEFSRGFRHELANRAWALRSTSGIARRLEGNPSRAFWAGYVRLEEFNAIRYRQAAQHWGVPSKTRRWTRLRGAVSGAAPRAVVSRFLRYAYPKTAEYVDVLRRLRDIGPQDGAEFLDYMVEQEILQVEMMRLALAKRYGEVPPLVDEFLRAYRGHNPF